MAAMLRMLDGWDRFYRVAGSAFNFAAWFLLLFFIATTGLMLADRDPPFAVLSVEPAAAKPGQYVWLRAKVRRDVDRRCSAAFSRYIFDANGERVADLGDSRMSHEGIAELERLTPGRMAVRIQVPPDMDAGEAMLLTSIAYACNQAHQWLPIHVTTRLPFTVLPP